MKKNIPSDQNPETVQIQPQEENHQVTEPVKEKPKARAKAGTGAAEKPRTAGRPKKQPKTAVEEVVPSTQDHTEALAVEANEQPSGDSPEAVALAGNEIAPEVIEGQSPRELSDAQDQVLAEAISEKEPPAAPEEVAGETPVVKVTARKTAAKSKEQPQDIKTHPAEDHEDEEEEIEESLAESLGHKSRLQLVELLEETVRNEDVNTIKNQVALIKVAYLQRTNEEREKMYQKAASEEEAESFEANDPLEERFKIAFSIYKHNKIRHSEQIEKEKIQNLEAKKHILEELKALISSEETLKKTYDDFKLLQERWKAIGMVPKNEAPGMWQNYHFLIEKFFDKVKINKELKDLDLRKNLEHKIELCEKAEELIIETSITKAFKRLQELHEEWKELGPVPQDKREEVWDRFKTASDKINERRHEFYGKIQEEQDANYAAKVVLCEQAEQLANKEYNSIKQWQESTQQVNELLKVWKSIGQASPKLNNEVWVRFKGQLDAYFANKKEFFGKLKEQQLHNYNLKVDLCVQAEALRLSTEWRNSSRDLIHLQEEWKKIGPVPRKHSDKIWKRFRAACDEFFQRKSEFFKNVQSAESENLVRKQELIRLLEDFEYSDNRQANLDKVKDIQRQWMETGHVPIKEKDRLQADYKTAINKIYDRLKVDANEQRMSNYRNRFENMKEHPDAHRIINKERNSLQIRIDELKDEILLWENNIGFFANSKQANVLKLEFEAKIAKAKEELAGMEARKKFLQKAAREQDQQEQQKS